MARPAVLLPVDLALAFTPERGWHYLAAPPTWWLAQQEQLLEDDERAREVTLLQAMYVAESADSAGVRVTSCRPGSGPCRRAHEHGSARRLNS